MPELQSPSNAPATSPEVDVISHRIRRSTQIGKIALAMSKAQGAMKGAVKDAENNFFESKYADLASVWDDCRLPLSGNEIAVFQMPSAVGPKVSITTLLAHSSGEWLEGELEMRSKDESPQGIGSVISYARRYALAAMTGVYQIDDDAEAAHGRSPTKLAGASRDGAHSSGPRVESPSSPAPAAPSAATPASVAPAEEPLRARPGGMFTFGKKHTNTPWNVVPTDYLEWALNADRTPMDVRQRIVDELSWRDYELARMNAQDAADRAKREAPLENDIP